VPHGTTQIIDAFLFELLRLFLHQNHLARIFCYFCSHSFTSVRLLRENEAKVKQARAKSRAKYPVRTKVKLRSLYAHLYIYDYKSENPDIKNNALVFDAVAKHLHLNVDDKVEVFDEDGKTLGTKTMTWIKRNRFYAYEKEVENTIKRRKRQIIGKHPQSGKRVHCLC
jgi:hypothetical protein